MKGGREGSQTAVIWESNESGEGRYRFEGLLRYELVFSDQLTGTAREGLKKKVLPRFYDKATNRMPEERKASWLLEGK